TVVAIARRRRRRITTIAAVRVTGGGVIAIARNVVFVVRLIILLRRFRGVRGRLLVDPLRRNARRNRVSGCIRRVRAVPWLGRRTEDRYALPGRLIVRDVVVRHRPDGF